jgi:hypothetical protein
MASAACGEEHGTLFGYLGGFSFLSLVYKNFKIIPVKGLA